MEKIGIKLELLDKVEAFNKYLLKYNSKGLIDEDIKVYLIEKDLIPHKCELCNQLPVWNKKALDLILDRRNNILNDNRIHNLRLLCPNCFYQFKTKKTIFFTKTKDNIVKCMDCKKIIKLSKSGKNKKKCINYRCNNCIKKLSYNFDLSKYNDEENETSSDIKII